MTKKEMIQKKRKNIPLHCSKEYIAFDSKLSLSLECLPLLLHVLLSVDSCKRIHMNNDSEIYGCSLFERVLVMNRTRRQILQRKQEEMESEVTAASQAKKKRFLLRITKRITSWKTYTCTQHKAFKGVKVIERQSVPSLCCYSSISWQEKDMDWIKGNHIELQLK